MAKCIKIKRKQQRVCIGSLNKKIIIYLREIQPPKGDNPDFTEEFSSPISVWAMIETVKPTAIFDTVEIEQVITHYFYIRKPLSIIDLNKWIEFESIRYNIVNVENLDQNNTFLKISTRIRGDKTVPATEA